MAEDIPLGEFLALIRQRWLHFVLVELCGHDVDRTSVDFQAQLLSASCVIKGLQLNEALSFARGYVPAEHFQAFADTLIDQVATSHDKSETLALANRYLEDKNAFFRFAVDLSERLTGVPYSLPTTLHIQRRAPLLVGHTNMALASSFGDAEKAAELERKVEGLMT